jgi:uridine phosphorylase
MTEKDLPILKADIIDIAPNVVVMGDPNRVIAGSKLLQNAKEVGSYREYLTITGSYRDKYITLCSHGVGASGASVCFQDLFRAKVKNIIRAGTCGSLQAHIKDGDIIISTSAVREDGTTPALAPIEYPAAANHDVINSLQKASIKYSDKIHTGITITTSSFSPELLPNNYRLWSKAGVLAVEMEQAVLLVLASLKNIRAGGLFVSDGYAFNDKQYDPHRNIIHQSVNTMLSIALDALVDLSD